MSIQREKHIISGPLLEVDFFPIFEGGRRIPVRPTQTNPSSEEQKKYNELQAMKKMIHKVNANFDGTDYFEHPTYAPEYAPQDAKQAQRDIVNYIRRVKTRRATELKSIQKEIKSVRDALKELPDNDFLKASLKKLKKQQKKLKKPLKYIYVIEEEIYKTGILAGRSNWHFHLFISGGLSDKVMESLWKNGIRVNVNNFQPERFGPESAALYMSKDPRGKKRFVCSQNLEKSKTPEPKDGRITRRGVERLATERVDDREYWERRYKGYRFLRCYARPNKYNGHWYLSVVMYKTADSAPKWDIAEWITSDGCAETGKTPKKKGGKSA